MTRTSSITVPVALVAALTIGSTFASADQERHRRGDAVERGEAQSRRDESAQPRTEAQPRREAQSQREAQPQREAPPQREAQAQRGDVQPRREAPRRDAQPRIEAPPAPRAENRAYAVPRTEPRLVEPRDGDRHRDDNWRRDDNRYRYDSRYRYDNRSWVYSRPRYFGYNVYRPYVFRPRYRLGLGVFIGYPVPYTYSYAYPVPVYGYRAPIAPVIVDPGSPLYGGVALDIWPDDAAVYVDGGYAGIVRDFDGTHQPLTLVAGRHRLQIVGSAGYAPLVFDVTVEPGQVIPYQGDLQPY